MIRAALAFLLSVCVSGAVADSQILNPPGSAVAGTYALGVCVPNTRDSLPCWASRVDVYYPSTVNANNAQIIIPGATGTSYSIAFQLRYTTVNAPVTSTAQVNWQTMNGAKQAVVAISTVAAAGQPVDFCNYAEGVAHVSGTSLIVTNWNSLHQQFLPGKQALYLGSSPYTATAAGANIIGGSVGGNGTYTLDTDLGTITGQAMIGAQRAPVASATTTSCDRVETNGQDDPEFYVELSDWISNGCVDQNSVHQCDANGKIGTVGGSAGKSLVGFSNGGELVERMWCEVNKHYARYISISGYQANVWYGSGGVAACTPSTPVPPLYILAGGLDPDTGICPPSTCTSAATNQFKAATWQGQNATPATINPPAIYYPAPYSTCASANSYAGSTVCTGPQVPFFGDSGFGSVATHTAIKSGFLDSYCYGGASCPVRLDYFYNAAHNPSSIESVTGKSITTGYLIPWEAAN